LESSKASWLHSFAGPTNQTVTFIELFFDLVFVFAVTQIASLLHEDVSAGNAAQAVLVFWLVWWAWAQFTWALNAADTTNPVVEIGTMLAAGSAIAMAVALPEAFEDRGLWFALAYVAVRTLGLLLYAAAASTKPAQRGAVLRFSVASLGGMSFVIAGGAIGGDALYWFWGLAILLDVLAAAVGGRLEGWDLNTAHFVERHGLFVIIALGETVIVTAGGLTGVDWTATLAVTALLLLGLIFGFWWSYFATAKPGLETALEQQTGSSHSKMARDVFSLLHFPMLCGVIAFAVVSEEALAHPEDPFGIEVRLTLSASLVLFFGSISVAMLRATGGLLVIRIVASVIAAVVILALGSVEPQVSLAIALVGVGTLITVEQLTIETSSAA
jgi:low temperature requirement protein LtrA